MVSNLTIIQDTSQCGQASGRQDLHSDLHRQDLHELSAHDPQHSHERSYIPRATNNSKDNDSENNNG
jgi:hypothetical protein